ncbi:MAG: hypothetical protein GX221_08165 [Candidatus Riflebacteria bacterium]|nr:hypothetical protein [Candidatus Riflebacteria bacterium]
MPKKFKSSLKAKRLLSLLLILSVVSLFGCTTGTKKDAGLTDFEAPNIPLNVIGTGKEGACFITWSANTEADLVGYKVYRSTNSGGPFVLIATVSSMAAPNYYDDNQGNKLVNDQYYYYKIAAFDTQGKESDIAKTNAIQVKAGLPSEEKPPRVVNLKARASTEAVYIAWDKITSGKIRGYNIYRGLSATAGGVTWIASVPQHSPAYLDVSVSKSSAENYTYVIRSFNDTFGESENSDPVQVSIKSGDDTIPSPPFNLKLTNDVDPVLTWSKPLNNEDGSLIFSGEFATKDLAAYLIFRANSSDGLFNLIGIVEDNGPANMTQSFKDINGSTYNLYAVRALDTNGNVSKLSSVTTMASDVNIPSVPMNVKAWSSSATESGIKLAWNSASNAASYNIYFSTVKDGGYTLYATGMPHLSESSSYVLTSYPSNFNQDPSKKGQKFEFGLPYFFKVSAVSSSGKESELSTAVSAYPGGAYVAMLEGEATNWEFEPAVNDNAQHVFLAYNSNEYPNIDYYSGSGSILLVPTSAGENGDRYRFGTGTFLSSSYFRLPSPPNSGGVYRYNVYAYYYPHTTSGTWRCQIREDGILSNALLQRDIPAHSNINKGRTVLNLGQIQIRNGVKGIDIDLTALAAGTGGHCTLFLDALVFVRVQ